MKTGSSILLVENNRSGQMSLKTVFENGDLGYDYVIAWSVSEVRKILGFRTFDLIITDYLLEDGSAFDIFNSANDIPVIVVHGSGDAEIALNAMKGGAYDYLIKDEQNHYLKVLPLTIENAMKRKKNEDRIRLLESAVENANDAIIILEAEPGESRGRRILYVNKAFTTMTGYTFNDTAGSTLRILRGPNTDLAVLEKLREALNLCKPVRVELINYRKDGSEFWVECNIVPFANEKGDFIHWVSIQRDITRRKKAEEEREKLLREIEVINANLNELNLELETVGTERTMSLMALTVADRIRNPASMIGARCRRILAKHKVSEDLHESLLYIIEDADKLNTIVMDFETLLKGRQSKFKYADLNSTVESVVSVAEKETSFKKIQMTVKISKDPLNINMQKDLLRIAVYHVVRNAIDATPSGGVVTIETFKNDDNVILSVSDTGGGIAKDDMENVFKPFFSTKEKGFGLGLPLVKQIVSEHLGNIHVVSKKDEGTTIKMVFPVRWKESKMY